MRPGWPACTVRGPDGSCTGLSWVDSLGALVLAVAGTLAVAAIPGMGGARALLARDYLSHAWLLLVAVGWYSGLRRRFPLGRADPRSLAPWFPVWAVLGVVIGVLALMSRPPAMGLPPGLSGVAALLGFQGLFVGPIKSPCPGTDREPTSRPV